MKILFFALLLATATCVAQTPAPEFSVDSAYAALQVLASDIGPRPMGSPAEQRAMSFAVAEFSRHGCDTSYVMPMTDANGVNTRSGIAVGVHRGQTGRIIVIGGHIDSAGPDIDGANDDGSGSATVIELARVFARRPTHSTIIFCCWGGEEEGLRGSTFFADHFPEMDSVDLMLQIDMADGRGTLEADPDASYERSAPPWLVEAAFDIFYNDLHFEGLRYATQYMTLNYSGKGASGSDHMPFIEKGIPAIDFTSDISYPIHSPLDNLSIFEPSGLRRSGLLVQRLVERFDGGVPSRTTDRYWLLNSRSWLLFLSHDILNFTVGFAIALGLVALVAQRRERRRRRKAMAVGGQEQMAISPVAATYADPPAPDAASTTVVSPLGELEAVRFPAQEERVHWSGLKLFIVTLLTQTFIWTSSSVVGTVAGVRFPWVNNLAGFVILGLVAGFLGLWISMRFVSHFRISRDPLPLYARALALLLLFTVLLGLLSVELALYPAFAVALIAVAMLVPNIWLKTLFVILSPTMILRLVFFEPFKFLLWGMTMPMGDGAISRVIMDAALIVTFSIITLPFVYAFAALYREVPDAAWPVRRFREWPGLAGLLVAAIALVIYLAGRPTYDERWQKAVRVTQQYNLEKDSGAVRLVGAEYLDGMHLVYGGRDTVLDGHLQTFMVPLSHEEKRVPWCSFEAVVHGTNPSMEKDVEVRRTLTVHSTIRPLSVSVTYHSPASVNVTSPWVTGRRGRMPAMSDTLQSFTWYAFPDSVLVIPVTFHLRGNQTVQEEVEVVYDTLAYPLRLSRPLTFDTRRTTVRHTASFTAGGTGDQLAAVSH